MYYHGNSSTPRSYANDYLWEHEKSAMNEVKTHKLHFIAPLILDIATIDMYLLDNVSENTT